MPEPSASASNSNSIPHSPGHDLQLHLLVSANHILHNHGLVDAFGHISIRDPSSPDRYIIAGYDPGAPALISNSNQFITYNINDSEPSFPNSPKGYSERFIHGEIFKQYPEVNCVVHSHSESVIPFMSAGVKIRPVFHMAGFLGEDGPPTFDVTKVYPEMETHTPDMLIKNAILGSALANTFRDTRQGDRGEKGEEEGGLGCSAVLQHKHGFTCVGSSIQRAVYRAVYLQKNCELLKSALDLNGGDIGKISYLNAEEAAGCARMNVMTEDKAFRLWLKEVEVNPLYRNEHGVPKDLPVGGMQD